MADIIRRKRNPETLAPATNLTNFPTIGTQWIQRFLRRHPELSAIRARNMDASRIKDTSPERLSKWFADLKKVIEEYDVSSENMLIWMKVGLVLEKLRHQSVSLMQIFDRNFKRLSLDVKNG